MIEKRIGRPSGKTKKGSEDWPGWYSGLRRPLRCGGSETETETSRGGLFGAW